VCLCMWVGGWVGVGRGAQGMQGRVAINSLILNIEKFSVIAQEVISLIHFEGW
jgi:hypothetical protein